MLLINANRGQRGSFKLKNVRELMSKFLQKYRKEVFR